MGFVPTNQTLACEYPSINAFLLDAVQTNSSIVLTIQKCPELCTLAWGSGNPDLSGVGVMISYWIQLAVIWIFGPLFAVWMLLPVENKERRNHLFVIIRQILLGLYTSAAIFSISIALAAKIIHDQGPPLFELSFLQSLIAMLVLNFVAISIIVLAAVNSSLTWFYTGASVPNYRYFFNLAGWLSGDNNGDTVEMTFIRRQQLAGSTLNEATERPPTGFPRNKVWCFLPFIYYIILFIVVALFIIQFVVSEDTVLAHNQLFSSCPDYAAILQPELEESPFALKMLNTTRANRIASSIFVFVCTIAFSLAIAQSPYLVAVSSTGLCAGATYYMWEMQQKRNMMRKLTDPSEFEDDQWGLGQVLAVVVWFQLIPQIAEAFVGEEEHEI